MQYLKEDNRLIQQKIYRIWQQEYPDQKCSGFPFCYNWEEATVDIRTIDYVKELSETDILQICKLETQIQNDFPIMPIIIINNTVIDGIHRCYAYEHLGINFVKAYRTIGR